MEENNNNNFDYKNISKKLPALGIITVVFFVLSLIFMKQLDLKYQKTVEETLEIILERNDIIRPEKFMEIYYNDNKLYQFIDLRSAADYVNGHLPGAINIPISKVLDEEYQEILNQDKKINILYYSDQCGSCAPWMILMQIGYKNNKILQGGYDYVKKNIIDNFSPMSGSYSGEKAKYDYAKIMKEKGGNKTSTSESDTPAKTTAPVKTNKKKEVEEEGGC